MDARDAWLTLSAWGAPAPRAVAEALRRGVRAQDLVRGQGPLPAGLRRALARARRRVDLDALRADVEGLGQVVLTPADAAWPGEQLAGLADPPPALYVRGSAPLPRPPAVAIVGTRACTPYGHDLARALAADLSAAGLDIVSGLALGIDGAAHEGALDAGGRTQAVLAGGLDGVYPPEHRALAERLVLDGGLVGEAPPGTRPERWRFPRRNRLVAALAAVIVVVEAPRRSGALVTARLGAEQGRDVLAVPGSVHWPLSAGCLDLLQRGEAGLVRSAADVLAVLGDRVPSRSTARSSGGGARATHEPDLVDPREARLWRLLEERDHQGEDELARRCGLDVLAVTALLAAWEIDGFVQRVPGAGVSRRS